ncbi:MAG: amidinotransferase [Anderseniella sp.]
MNSPEIQSNFMALDDLGPVNSHNEWDPLEEVMVGRLEGAVIPSNHPVVTCNVPGMTGKMFGLFSGIKYPSMMINPAQEELEGFIKILEDLGIKVVRPRAVNYREKIQTPEFKSRGFCNTCPRDSMLVVGNEIIETPMAWPCRYFETHSYRDLLKDYFQRGARWTSAPKPELADELFDSGYTIPAYGEDVRYVINEWEPVFDAADFVRCGRDIFVIKSNVTNDFGIDWLQRHLGEEYRVHRLKGTCRQPMHIDTTFMPLAPGKVLVNPEYINVNELPDMFRNWDILIAPEPDPITGDKLLELTSMCGKWLSMNVLMIDEKRVICEKHHTGMIKALEGWGFEPIPCSFLHYAPFGGAFHCATLDIRRRGTLENYFD